MFLKEHKSMNDFSIFRIQENIDAANCLEFQRRLTQFISSNKKIILDCSGLTFLDGCGLGVLIDACIYAKQAKKVICFQNLNHQLKQIFQFFNIENLIMQIDSNIFESTKSNKFKFGFKSLTSLKVTK